MKLPDEFQGLATLTRDDTAQLEWMFGLAPPDRLDATVELTAQGVEAIQARIAELLEIARQNALVAPTTEED